MPKRKLALILSEGDAAVLARALGRPHGALSASDKRRLPAIERNLRDTRNGWGSADSAILERINNEPPGTRSSA